MKTPQLFIFNSEKLKDFPLIIKNNKRMSALIISVQHCIGSFRQEKEIKATMIGKKEVETSLFGYKNRKS